jgi:hypothetical protein
MTGKKIADFIALIDDAVLVAEKRRSIENEPAIASSLTNVIALLRRTRSDAVGRNLSPSGGATLGLAREVLDWGEPLGSPLVRSLGAVDRYYRDKLR